MFKNRTLFISMFVLTFVGAKADSVQSIDVLNNCAQALNLAANNADKSFTVSLKVPAYAKAFVISQITELNVLQDKLFAGIFKDSVIEVEHAIVAGADVNKLREGKTPLDWALSFGMVNAAACLLQYGAR